MSNEEDIARWLNQTALGEHAAVRAPLAPVKAAPRRIALPKPRPAPADLWRTLTTRRSRRDLVDNKPLTLDNLATLLWAAQGITAPAWLVSLRTAPSAGALYPNDVYVAARYVTGVDIGLWRLDPGPFSLDLVRSGDEALNELGTAALGQQVVKRAAAVLILAATIERCSSKYGLRSERYIMLDAGHISQNVLLAAEALGLGACPVGSFMDEALNRLLQIDGKAQAAVYLTAVGPR